jgi:hypothetical protein
VYPSVRKFGSCISRAFIYSNLWLNTPTEQAIARSRDRKWNFRSEGERKSRFFTFRQGFLIPALCRREGIMIGLFHNQSLMAEGKACFSSQQREDGQTTIRSNFRTKGYTISLLSPADDRDIMDF